MIVLAILELLFRKIDNMKKITLLIFVIMLTCCGGNNPKKEELKYKYGVEEMYEKIWETNAIHNETCLLTEDEDGRFSARLMFTPKRILAVKNYGLTKDYSSSDYIIEGDKIIATETSTIPHLTKANVDCDDVPPLINGTYSSDKADSGKILFTEGAGICMYQICVSYEKEEKWSGSSPIRYGERFANTYSKLEQGEDVVIVSYGASTSTGCNASSILGIEPFQESFLDGFLNDIKLIIPLK